MKIEGKKYLDKNNYNKIVIDLLGKEYSVKVKCSKDYNCIDSDYLFTDELNNLNDNEKVIEIVEYFLRNNKIFEIADTNLKGYEGGFSIAYSSPDRLLAVKLPDNEFGKLIGNKILKKYYDDRKLYCLTNDIKSISSSYGKGTFYGDNKVCLITKYSELTKSEELFLKELILDKLDYEHRAYFDFLESDTGIEDIKFKAPHLVCGDLKIRFGSESIIRSVDKIVYAYNCELRKEKEKQLVMKGWNAYGYGKYYNG